MSRFDWIQNPFHVEVERVCHLTLKAHKEFAELSSDSSLKTMFAKMSKFVLGWHQIGTSKLLTTCNGYSSTFLINIFM